MTTAEKISEIIKDQYGNYQGRLVAPLGMLHARLRRIWGDEKFLEFLEERKRENPCPIYHPINPTTNE